ncbi:MAG: S8 family serine peptidase [Bacteroidales bacterium]|nr:S8 family serine peptidase [Bacteroidales bacterium]
MCKKLQGEDRQILSGAIKHIDEEFMFCYDNKVVVVAWGMSPESNKHIVKGAIIHDLKIQAYHKISFIVGDNGTLINKLVGNVKRVDGTILGINDLPNVTPKSGFTFKCWEPNPIGMKVDKPLTFVAKYVEVVVEESFIEEKETPIEEATNEPETVRVTFLCGGEGCLIGTTEHIINKGSYIDETNIPSVIANDGFTFVGWNDSTNKKIDDNTVFTAAFERINVNCRFVSGEFGDIEGQDTFVFPYGTTLDENDVPKTNPKKGYKFVGWNKSPNGFVLNADTTFIAQYEKKIPWYKRFWRWLTGIWTALTGKGCLKWLLWILLIILFIWLLSFLFRGCGSSHGSDTVVPTPVIETPDGRTIDNNGPIKGIVGDDGSLPDNNVVAPIVGEDGQNPPIISNPGAPDIVANRLNIYFENADVNLEQFIADLSQIYSEDQCQVIGLDRNVPMMQILIPENMRDVIRENLNKQLPNYDFFIIDESIFSLKGNGRENMANQGWHLDAIDLKEGWEITKGNPEIVVAVVDDGIDANHDILKGRIINPYNVFTQDNRLSTGEGHGTHVAGLAVGSDKMYDTGVSGIAPKCKLMPVQVFDNGLCTFSSITNGIMYAIHNGAHVINVSIGPNFNGLDILPIQDQEYIARTQFKNEEIVWKRIINVANEHNAIIVFAAGNDNILANIPPENRTDKTLNVAAVDMQIQGTDFTNYGIGSNISAPGKDILSSVPNNEFAAYDGTSMAAPIVSGTIALMKSCNPEISISEVLHILQATGERVSDYVPPMIQVDDALIALTTGIFPEMPSNDGDNNNGDDSVSPSSGDNVSSPKNPNDGNNSSSDGETNIGNNPGAGAGTIPADGNPNEGSDGVTNPSDGNSGQNPGDGNNDIPDDKDGTDYDAIRRLIEAYKQKIIELEKLLPENK